MQCQKLENVPDRLTREVATLATGVLALTGPLAVNRLPVDLTTGTDLRTDSLHNEYHTPSEGTACYLPSDWIIIARMAIAV
jgi:hypothetical protein